METPGSAGVTCCFYNYFGIVLLKLGLIRDVLLLVGAPGFYLDVFIGALIVGAVALNRAFRPSN